MLIFAERIKELREQNKLSLATLSQKLGVSDAAICKWENNLAEPKASYIRAIADFFEVSTDYLLGVENEIGLKKYSAPAKKQETVELTPDGKELIEIFNALEKEYRAQILEYARYFAQRRGIKTKKF